MTAEPLPPEKGSFQAVGADRVAASPPPPPTALPGLLLSGAERARLASYPARLLGRRRRVWAAENSETQKFFLLPSL